MAHSKTDEQIVYIRILQVGKFIQLFATFIGGFVVAFIKGWLLTLVMLSSIPPLAISGALMTVVISKMASRGQDAYSQAAVVVEQTIGSIRTVSISYIVQEQHTFQFKFTKLEFCSKR